MPVTHTNRKGQTYTLYEGKTKTGKPKFYMAKKPSSSGHPIETIPAGYEIRESPANGAVNVRKVKPCMVTEEECSLVREAVKKNSNVSSFLVDGDGEAITVYLSDTLGSPEQIGRLLGITAAENWTRRTRYSPEMRFVLIDAERRLFAADRWCYRGSIDDWFPIGRSGPLSQLVEKLTPHLGKESFYELY